MGCGGSKATTVAIDPANSQQSDGGAATAEMGGSSPVAKSPTTERVPTPAGEFGKYFCLQKIFYILNLTA